MSIFWDLVAVVAGILGTAFFAGIETGLISVNRVRLRHQVERRNRRALILSPIVENPEQLLGTTLVGNSLAGVVAAVFMAVLVTSLFGPGYGSELAATVIGSAVLLVLGEIVPKTLFRHYSYRLCMTFADVLNAAAWLFAPLVVLLGGLMRAIARVGVRAEQPRRLFVTREELKYLAREGEAGGELTADERQMIHGVFDFPHKTVLDVMVPMAEVAVVAPEATIQQVLELSQRLGFARFPVLAGQKVVGFVNVYEILFADAARDGARPVEPFVRKPALVPSTERVDRVLPRLRAGRVPISVVVDPDGRHVGIVTMEDMIEEIVGQL